jgi:hypothetical protein
MTAIVRFKGKAAAQIISKRCVLYSFSETADMLHRSNRVDIYNLQSDVLPLEQAQW